MSVIRTQPILNVRDFIIYALDTVG
jgi:hypothetical protein